MKKLYNKIYGAVKYVRYRLAEERRIKYRIVELNLKKQEVVLNVKRRSLILRYNYAEVIKEIWLIEALSIEDAALLGYFYGRCYRISQADKKQTKKISPSPLLLKNNSGRYKILYHYRDGNIAYTDSRNQQQFLENPQAIMRNSHVINHFDSTQACYIGMLAGLSYEKMQTKNVRPSLKIVS
ncbi:MAG: hypothetical protein ACYCQI_12700 [Gammaproteobacteria bacterium]